MDIEEADGRAAELAQAFVELAGALASGYRAARRILHRPARSR